MNNENKDIKDIKSLEDNNNLKKEEKYASGMQVSKDDISPKEVKDVSKEEISNSPSNLNKGNKELDNSKEEKVTKIIKPSFLKSDFPEKCSCGRCDRKP